MHYQRRYGTDIRNSGAADACFDRASPEITARFGSCKQQQQRLAQQLVFVAGVGALDRGYVALHGTGTPLGDPIEMGALGQALAVDVKGEAQARLAVGSVKSCYGHSEGAAGLTGTLLAVQTLREQVQGHRFPTLANQHLE